MFYVATFGHNSVSTFNTLVGNYNQTSFETLRDAEFQSYKDMLSLMAQGYHFVGRPSGEATEQMAEFRRYDDQRIVGIWEA